MDFDLFGYGQIGVFGFVLAIILIGSFFNYLKVRSNNETIRALAASGQGIDPELLGHLKRESGETGPGMVIAGFITVAVAIGLYFFGSQLGVATGDDQVGPVFRAIAMIPGFVGAALLVAGLFITVFRKRGKGAAVPDEELGF
ncbi:hypothetical protein [Parvularcula lutaonensis]|uniref:Uncharacterized protein n=1 Tax=Parvularcula lutaonensis TaxID=491923 RepID=A0ABV7M998_9PROT|nr:hypothetical protein [Parvularcula lutaonensis]GGY46708.1 hypothetical protein GCM10007148_14790 [Parvularcula lutaonensis]